MTDNWELAVSQAQGEYVTVLGDDDGLLLRTLEVADRILARTNARALRWGLVSYLWPNAAGVPNGLHIPMRKGVVTRCAHSLIGAVANSREVYDELPMIYNSFVHRDVIDAVRRKVGRVFLGTSPDVSSGLAFGYLVKEYAAVLGPLAIRGIPAASNGVGTINLQGKTDSARDFQTLNDAAGLRWHAEVPPLPLLASIQADAYCQVRDQLFPGDARWLVDRKGLLMNCLAEISRLNSGQESQADARMEVMAAWVAQNPPLRRIFERERSALASRQHPAKDPGRPSLSKHGLLALDASAFGISDVYGAAELCEKLVDYRYDDFAWPCHEPGRPTTIGGKALGRLLRAARVLVRGK